MQKVFQLVSFHLYLSFLLELFLFTKLVLREAIWSFLRFYLLFELHPSTQVFLLVFKLLQFIFVFFHL
jgi:hypothetical protein